jgi:hypothetical protein
MASIEEEAIAHMTRKISTFLLFGALALALPLFGQAQQPANIGQTLSTLADQPATHTGFVFDRSMMQLAQGLLESNGMDAHRAAAAINSIVVDNYRYPRPAFYTPEAMTSLIDSYHAAGWKHLVNANQTVTNTAQPKAPVTDLWLHFSGADIDGVTVLSRASRDMNVIQLTCDLRPLDLLHLSGHFGIPKVDPSAVMVPAPEGK